MVARPLHYISYYAIYLPYISYYVIYIPQFLGGFWGGPPQYGFPCCGGWPSSLTSRCDLAVEGKAVFVHLAARQAKRAPYLSILYMYIDIRTVASFFFLHVYEESRKEF